MIDQADGRYSHRPWDRRPGDQVDPSVALGPADVIMAVAMTAPVPLPADIDQPRLLGYERSQPSIQDVLGAGPVPLMRDTPTRQDSGMQPTGTTQ